jgi:metal-responsive CopG/Arc/MetJ family transcriptional regulator
MSVITVRLSDDLLEELDARAESIHLARAEYIRRAIQHMNEEISAQERKHKLTKASLRVRAESMRVNAEFSRIEHDPKT